MRATIWLKINNKMFHKKKQMVTKSFMREQMFGEPVMVNHGGVAEGAEPRVKIEINKLGDF